MQSRCGRREGNLMLCTVGVAVNRCHKLPLLLTLIFHIRMHVRACINREYTLLYLLDHPGLVKVFGHGVDEKKSQFYVMEYIDGGPLSGESAVFLRVVLCSFPVRLILGILSLFH